MLETPPRSSTPEERLFAAVVGLALRDACLRPGKEGKRLRVAEDAMSAHRFIWTDAIDAYLHWLDMDAGQFRVRLENIMADMSALKVSGFMPEERRAFRINKRLWEEQHAL